MISLKPKQYLWLALRGRKSSQSTATSARILTTSLGALASQAARSARRSKPITVTSSAIRWFTKRYPSALKPRFPRTLFIRTTGCLCLQKRIRQLVRSRLSNTTLLPTTKKFLMNTTALLAITTLLTASCALLPTSAIALMAMVCEPAATTSAPRLN